MDEEQSVPLKDRCIAAMKGIQIILNTGWVGVVLYHFYTIIEEPPFTSIIWPMEVLFLITIGLHVFNVIIVLRYGCALVYNGLSCLFLQNIVHFLLLCLAYFLIRFLYGEPLVQVMIDYGISFFQSLIFMKLIYIRLRQRQKHKPPPRLDLLAVGGLPSNIDSKVCSICLDQMPLDYEDATPRQKKPQLLVGLPCSETSTHYFHFVCFKQWAEKSPHCPNCRGTRYLNFLKIRRKHSQPLTARPLRRVYPEPPPPTE